MKYTSIFFDRDGVINKSIIREGRPYSPRSLKEFILYPEIEDLFLLAEKANIPCFIFTNQPDVARGEVKRELIEKFHQKIFTEIPWVKQIYCCFHDDHDECLCRKPRPGMLQMAGQDHRLNLEQAFVVGDRWKDIEAGRQVKANTIFLDHGYQEQRPEHPTYTVTNHQELLSLIKEKIQEESK